MNWKWTNVLVCFFVNLVCVRAFCFSAGAFTAVVHWMYLTRFSFKAFFVVKEDISCKINCLSFYPFFFYILEAQVLHDMIRFKLIKQTKAIKKIFFSHICTLTHTFYDNASSLLNHISVCSFRFQTNPMLYCPVTVFSVFSQSWTKTSHCSRQQTIFFFCLHFTTKLSHWWDSYSFCSTNISKLFSNNFLNHYFVTFGRHCHLDVKFFNVYSNCLCS